MLGAGGCTTSAAGLSLLPLTLGLNQDGGFSFFRRKKEKVRGKKKESRASDTAKERKRQTQDAAAQPPLQDSCPVFVVPFRLPLPPAPAHIADGSALPPSAAVAAARI